MFKLLTLLLASSMTVMAGAALAPALPQIQSFFAAEPRSVFWVKLMLTLPGLFTAIAAPFAGAIADRIGRKPLLVASAVIYGIGGTSGLYLSSIGGLLVGRALLGLAVGGVMTASTALIADYYQGSERNRVMGIQATFMSFGGVVFLIVSGAIADIGWRLPFLIYLVAFGVATMAFWSLHEAPRPGPGAIPSRGLLPADPVPLWALIGIYGLVFWSMATFYLVPVQLPFYLDQLAAGQGSSGATGIAIAAPNLVSAIVSMGYRALKERLSFGAISALGFLMMGVGYGVIALATSYGAVLAGLLVMGVSLGLNIPNLNVWLNAVAPVRVRGRAVGALTTCLFLGQFMSPILSQPVTEMVGMAATFGWCSVTVVLVAGGIPLVQTISAHGPISSGR